MGFVLGGGKYRVAAFRVFSGTLAMFFRIASIARLGRIFIISVIRSYFLESFFLESCVNGMPAGTLELDYKI